MHPTVLAEKRAIALSRVTSAAKTISTALQLETVDLDQATAGTKDPQIKELRRLEAIANLLEAVAEKNVLFSPHLPAPIGQGDATVEETAVPANEASAETTPKTRRKKS